MQILFGAHETVVKLNSPSIRIDFIKNYIYQHFRDVSMHRRILYIPQSTQNIHYRLFLLKWIYALYAKKRREFHQNDFKEILLKRHHKAIKIILAQEHKEIKQVSSTKDEKVVLTPLQKAHMVLGTKPGDNAMTLKQRYRTLAKQYHPDKVHSSDYKNVILYTKKFQNILQAYETLVQEVS